MPARFAEGLSHFFSECLYAIISAAEITISNSKTGAGKLLPSCTRQGKGKLDTGIYAIKNGLSDKLWGELECKACLAVI